MSNIIEDIVIRTVVEDCDDTTIIEGLTRSTIEPEPDTDITLDDNQTTIVEQITDREIISVAEQGPPGADGSGVLQINAGPILAGNTLIVDQISITLFRSVKWLLTVQDNITDKHNYSEIAAIHDNTVPAHWRAGILGDKIDVIEQVDILSGFMRLELTNNHTETINVNILRLGTLN